MSAATATSAPAGAGGGKVEEGPTGGLPSDVEGFGPGRIIKVSADMYVAGQITEAQILAIAKHKGKLGSILNLRKPGEGTFLGSEEALCKSVGVQYVHVPMHPSSTTDDLMDRMYAQMDTMQKPVLVHCASAMRAGAMAVAYETVRKQLQLDDLETMAARTPFGRTSNQAFRDLVRGYAEERLEMISHLPNIVSISDDLFVGPTISEEHMRALAKAGRMKTVINLRSADEAGSLGLGMLSKEKEVVEELGLIYINIPTTPGEVPSPEEVAAVREALAEATEPVFMHCRQMRRTAAVVRALGMAPQVLKDVPTPTPATECA